MVTGAQVQVHHPGHLAADPLDARLEVGAGDGEALLPQGVADALDEHGRVAHPPQVVDVVLGHQVGRLLALAAIHLGDLAQHRQVGADGGELQAVVALGEGPAARRLHVGVTGAPHEGDDPVQREARLLEGLDGHRRSSPEQVGDDPVGPEALDDAGDLGGHLRAGGGTGHLFYLQPLPLGDAAQHVQGLPAGRVVVVQEGHLGLARTPFPLPLVQDEAHRCPRLRPVAGSHGEAVGEALAVGRRRRTVAREGADYLVAVAAVNDGGSDGRAVGDRADDAGRFLALVALHALVGAVAVLAELHPDGVAVYATLEVDQVDVVLEPGLVGHADELRGTRPVIHHADDDGLLGGLLGDGRLAGRLLLPAGGQEQGHGRQRCQRPEPACRPHDLTPSFLCSPAS